MWSIDLFTIKIIRKDNINKSELLILDFGYLILNSLNLFTEYSDVIKYYEESI